MVKAQKSNLRLQKRKRWGCLGSGLVLVVVLSPTLVGGQSPVAAPQAVMVQEAVAAERQAHLEAARLILEQGLREGNADQRREVVIALSLTRVENNPFPLLETALADKDVYVQVAACATLSGLPDPRALRLLRQALGNETPEVAFAAAKALYAQGDQQGRQALLDVATGECRARSGYFSVQRRNMLRTMKTPGGFFRMAFRYGIGFAPIPGLGIGLSSLAGLLADANLSGRAQAIAALPPVQDHETVAMLREALTDEDWSVRAAAVHALAVSDQRLILRDLVPLFQDKKDAVRYRAAAAYLRLTTPAVSTRPPVKVLRSARRRG